MAAPTACTPDEQVVFQCDIGARRVAVCASRGLGPQGGQLQYRYGRPAAVVAFSGDTPGITRSDDLQLLALRGSNTAAIRIEGVASGAAELIHADARVYAGRFDGEESASLAMDAARKAYVFVARGSVVLNGVPLSAGDAAY